MKFKVTTPNQVLIVEDSTAPGAAERVAKEKVIRMAGYDTLGGIFETVGRNPMRMHVTGHCDQRVKASEGYGR